MPRNIKLFAVRNQAVSVLSVVLLTIGCHKQASTVEIQPPQAAAQPTDGAQPAPAVQPAPPPSPAVATRTDNTVHEAVAGDVDPFLTGQLQIFIQQKGRMPATFSELASARLDSIPRPPAGKKWAIDGADKQVKATDAM